MTQEDYVKLLGAQHTPVDKAALLDWLQISAHTPLSAADPAQVKMWKGFRLNGPQDRAERHLLWMNRHSHEIAAATTEEAVLDKVHWYPHEVVTSFVCGDYEAACSLAVARYHYYMGQRQVSDATVPARDGRTYLK